jgi:hypothetical protein
VISTQVSVALGPSLGGLLVGALGWQAVFLANVPLVVISGVLALRALPAGRALRDSLLMRQLDLPGAAAFAVAMTALMALLLSITTSPTSLWWAAAGRLSRPWPRRSSCSPVTRLALTTTAKPPAPTATASVSCESSGPGSRFRSSSRGAYGA